MQDITIVNGEGVWEQLRWHSPGYRPEAALGLPDPQPIFFVFNSAWQVFPLWVCCRAFGIDANIHSCSSVSYLSCVLCEKVSPPLSKLATSFIWWFAGLVREETVNNCSLFTVFVTRDFVSLFCHLMCFAAWVLCYFWYGRRFVPIFITFSSITSSGFYLPDLVLSRWTSPAGNMLALKLESCGCISAKNLQPPETSLGDFDCSFCSDIEE